jgi:hypothetical protein
MVDFSGRLYAQRIFFATLNRIELVPKFYIQQNKDHNYYSKKLPTCNQGICASVRTASKNTQIFKSLL